MCGRYAIALPPSRVRQMLSEQSMPSTDAPEDRGIRAPQPTYNFAPGSYGIVYRAEIPDRGDEKRVTYKLQSMKWGLVPFWTRRSPDYSTIMRTINCRDDSLSSPGGMWATMKATKRCVVLAQGFYEWLKTGSKEKLPHYIKRKDGQLMCFAGLWDCVQFQDSDEKLYTYTIITTDSNRQMKFIHDRMPVVFDPGSENLRTWLDPTRRQWSPDLQSLLSPFNGELEIYPVTKAVGKIGNDSPSFVIPLNSEDNQANIANWFKNQTKDKDKQITKRKQTPTSNNQSPTKKPKKSTRSPKGEQGLQDIKGFFTSPGK